MAFDVFDGHEAGTANGPERVDVAAQLKDAVEKDADRLDQLRVYPEAILAESYAAVMSRYVEEGKNDEASRLMEIGKDLGLENFEIADPVVMNSARDRLFG